MTNQNNTAPASDRNVRKNSNVSPIGKMIGNVLANAKEDGNTQSRLVVAMFEQEVTFSEASLGAVLKTVVPGGKRAYFIRTLCNLSPDFQALVSKETAWKDKDKDVRKNDARGAMDIDNNNRAMAAAISMFERACISVYGLRAMRHEVKDKDGKVKLVPSVERIALYENGKGIRVLLSKTDEFGDKHKMHWTGAEALRNGNKMLNKAPKKKEEKTTEGNGSTNTLPKVRAENWQQSAKYLHSLPSLDKLSEDESKALDNLLASMIAKRLVADGTIMKKELIEFMKEHHQTVKVA